MLKLDDVSTGASNDIMRATEIAREMVTKYGFSERLGPVNYSSGDEVFLGRDFSTRRDYSEQTAAEIALSCCFTSSTQASISSLVFNVQRST